MAHSTSRRMIFDADGNLIRDGVLEVLRKPRADSQQERKRPTVSALLGRIKGMGEAEAVDLRDTAARFLRAGAKGETARVWAQAWAEAQIRLRALDRAEGPAKYVEAARRPEDAAPAVTLAEVGIEGRRAFSLDDVPRASERQPAHRVTVLPDDPSASARAEAVRRAMHGEVEDDEVDAKVKAARQALEGTSDADDSVSRRAAGVARAMRGESRPDPVFDSTLGAARKAIYGK